MVSLLSLEMKECFKKRKHRGMEESIKRKSRDRARERERARVDTCDNMFCTKKPELTGSVEL